MSCAYSSEMILQADCNANPCFHNKSKIQILISVPLIRPNSPKLTSLDLKTLTLQLFSFLCVHCSQRSFLLASTYLHYNWCQYHLAVVKYLPIPFILSGPL